MNLSTQVQNMLWQALKPKAIVIIIIQALEYGEKWHWNNSIIFFLSVCLKLSDTMNSKRLFSVFFSAPRGPGPATTAQGPSRRPESTDQEEAQSGVCRRRAQKKKLKKSGLSSFTCRYVFTYMPLYVCIFVCIITECWYATCAYLIFFTDLNFNFGSCANFCVANVGICIRFSGAGVFQGLFILTWFFATYVPM
jgi:hypothetical protein